jgi:hypothetical protein
MAFPSRGLWIVVCGVSILVEGRGISFPTWYFCSVSVLEAKFPSGALWLPFHFF